MMDKALIISIIMMINLYIDIIVIIGIYWLYIIKIQPNMSKTMMKDDRLFAVA